MGVPRRDEERAFDVGPFPLLVRAEVIWVACVADANISTMDGSTLRKEFKELVAAWDAAFWLAKFVVAAGGDWPRFPFCCLGMVVSFPWRVLLPWRESACY